MVRAARDVLRGVFGEIGDGTGGEITLQIGG